MELAPLKLKPIVFRELSIDRYENGEWQYLNFIVMFVEPTELHAGQTIEINNIKGTIEMLEAPILSEDDIMYQRTYRIKMTPKLGQC